MTTTLFAHLATRFQTHPENLATEALCFVLQQSAAARRAVIDHAGRVGAALPADLRFSTQAAGADGAIPDLVGEDEDGETPLLVEAKFWAGLTTNQPVTYLARLKEDCDGVLVFVAPGARFETLWRELSQRCGDAGLQFESPDPEHEGFRFARTGERSWLALTSWRSMLEAIETRLSRSEDSDLIADVRQLAGLCNQMDTDAFLPLRSEELTAMAGRRVVQFCELADSVTEELVRQGVGDIRRVQATSTRGRYGRHLRLKGHGALIYFTAYGWAGNVTTPLWLKLWGRTWKSGWSEGLSLAEHLRELERAEPTRLVVQDNLLAVPLHLKVGVERHEVVTDLVAQVLQVAALLPAKGMEGDEGSDVEPDGDVDEGP